LLFLTDFVTLSLATDKVGWSHKPDTWNITGLVKVAVALGVVTLIEHFGLLYLGLKYFGLQASIPELNTFVFEMLFFSGILTIFIVRERGHFWNSFPSRTLLLAIILDIILVGTISTIGIPGLAPLPLYYTISIVVYYFLLTLLVNDSIKYLLIKYAGMAW
jgi:H+-transporting ATPase